MGDELKPCPFCGGAPHFDHDDHGWNWIECGQCHVSTKAAAHAGEDCRPMLAEDWNRRAASPVTADTMGDAKDAARYRWLRDNATREGRGYRLAEVGTDQKDQRPLKYRWYVDSKGLDTETLDAAIDAAMKEDKTDGR